MAGENIRRIEKDKREGKIMTSPTLDRLIQRGKSGILTIYEQRAMAEALEMYRAVIDATKGELAEIVRKSGAV